MFTGRLGEEFRVYHFLVVVIGSQCVNPCLFEQLEYLSCSWTCNTFSNMNEGVSSVFHARIFIHLPCVFPRRPAGAPGGTGHRLSLSAGSLNLLFVIFRIG